MTGAPSNYDIRPATNADLDEIVSVCGAALGWTSPDFDTELFRWKHFTNAFGRSLLLVAVDSDAPSGEQIKAVRPFMRWRFARSDGTTWPAARAVDTATLPEAQGQGLFRALTLAGLELLEEEGCGFVFNTPNEKSLAGYLTMGWRNAGGVPLAFGFASPKVAYRLSQSRTAAQKQSISTPDLGISIEEALTSLIEPHLAADAASNAVNAVGLRTDHTIDTLRWRYASGPVDYRFVRTSTNGGLIVRLRQRGNVRELVLAQTVGTVANKQIWSHAKNAMDAVEADVCIAPSGIKRLLKTSRVGPTLALRPLHNPLTDDTFDWSPGDVELF